MTEAKKVPKYKHGDVIIFYDKTSPAKKAKLAWMHGRIASVDKLGVYLVARENGSAYAVIEKDVNKKVTDYDFKFTPKAKKVWSNFFSDDIKEEIEKIGVTQKDIDEANALYKEGFLVVEKLSNNEESVQGQLPEALTD